MAADQKLDLYEVTASIEAKATEFVQAEDPESARELVEQRISVVVAGDEIEGTVGIENVGEVERGN